MTQKARQDLDALELLMQDHREVESLLREFEFLQQNRKATEGVIANACAELRMHDTLETAILYAEVRDAANDEKTDRMVAEAEAEHDKILELVEKVELARTDDRQRDKYFSTLVEHVKRHVMADETERFPLVKRLARLDLGAVTAAMKKRKSALMSEMSDIFDK